jgi:RNA polymerase sigma-70 factor (ECF subfamily)
LFLLLSERLTEFSKSIVKSKEDAEEIVSDFFIKIWQKRSSLKQLENPKLYFFISVKNLSINKLAANNRKASHMPEEWNTTIQSVFFNPEELMISRESVRNIMSTINQLPPKCKMIFKMVKVEGLRYNDVSKLLSISPKTVESQMAIALRRIKSCTDFKNEFPQLHSILTNGK